MAHQQLSGNFMRPDLNGNQDGTHGGSIAMVLVLAIAFLAVAAGFVTVGRANSAPFILTLLAVFAMSGVFLLFAVASGVLTISDKGSANALLKSVVDSARDGGGPRRPRESGVVVAAQQVFSLEPGHVVFDLPRRPSTAARRGGVRPEVPRVS